MEFSCNPLDRELLKQKNSGAKNECKEQFANQVNDFDAFFARILLTVVNKRRPRNPYCQCPRE